VVAAYEATYARILAVTTDVTDVAVVGRSWRCTAAKKEQRQENSGFHAAPTVFIGDAVINLDRGAVE